MNTTTIWEWLKAFPFGGEVRRYTAPGPFIEYRRGARISVYFLAAAMLLEVFFSPLRHAPVAARIGLLACVAAGLGVWIAASVKYVLAWDELQRRALAESGAVTTLVLLCVLALYAFVERMFAVPALPSILWAVAGAAIWFVALPLIRRHYEA